MGGDWKKLQAREAFEQRWIFYPMHSSGFGSKMVMLVLSGRKRFYEGLEAVVRETHNVGSGP